MKQKNKEKLPFMAAEEWICADIWTESSIDPVLWRKKADNRHLWGSMIRIKVSDQNAEIHGKMALSSSEPWLDYTVKDFPRPNRSHLEENRRIAIRRSVDFS